MKFTSFQRLSALLSALCLLTIYAVSPLTDIHCKYEELPDTFNSLSYLGLNEEFHFHGEFYANFTALDKRITFHLTRQSAFRVYTAPHDVDVDMWLYNSTGNSIAHSSLNIGTEEVIFATLSPGSYTLKLNFFGSWIGQYHPHECDSLLFEAAIVPLTLLSPRGNQLGCPSKENLPVLNLSPLATGGALNYDSDVDEAGILMNLQSPAGEHRSDVRWVIGYNFTLSPSQETSSLWELTAVLGYDFLTGNSLGLLLTPSGMVPTPTCAQSGNCSISAALRKNENDLRTVIPPGNYTLWIYDQIGERDPTLTPCTPFSLRISLALQPVDESPLSCQAFKLPSRLVPGFYDEPPGVVHFHAHVLIDLDHGDRVIGFTVTERSAFRVFTAPHRVDIDLRVSNASGTVDAAYNWNGEEAVALQLEPGEYNLTVIYFGMYAYRFCETFEIEIALFPLSLYTDVCLTSSTSPAYPDLSGLPASLTTNHSFSLAPTTRYRFRFEQNYAQRIIYQQNFTVAGSYILRAELGSDFLMGDMEVWLMDLNTEGSSIYRGSHRRNSNFLALPLHQGNYSIAIVTGKTQRQEIPHFPTCAEYTFSLSILRQDAAGDCWEHPSLPKTLNSPQYLGGRGVVHLHDHFLVPLTGTQVSSMDKISFTVERDSFFRVWTEAHQIIDIDFYLYENNTYANRSISNSGEEVILWNLRPHVTYSLEVLYYHFGSSDPHEKLPPCFIFNFQLAISPILTSPPPCQDTLPPASLIPSYHEGSAPFTFAGNFSFQQTSRSLRHLLPFTISSGFMFFRAVIQYDFVWTDLSLILRVHNDTDVWGINGYNRNDFKTSLLGPGSYELEIYEPSQMLMAEHQRCAKFELQIYYEPALDPASQQGDPKNCPTAPMPSRLNTISQLSPLSANQVHIQRNFLVNVKERVDYMDFHLNETSLMKMWVPFHGTVDIDLILRNGTSAHPGGVVARHTGIVEEALRVVLAPGDYVLSTPYYGFSGGQLPGAEECVHFPAELSITPLSYLNANTDLTTACTYSPSAQVTLNIDEASSESYNRDPAQPLSRSFIFSLASPAVLDLRLRFDFPSNALALDLQANLRVGLPSATSRTFHAPLGYNHAYFKKILPAGDYEVTVNDPFLLGTNDPALKCGQYTIDYVINTTAVPADYCDDTLELPTDLFTSQGGSSAYGGPQAADGSIRIFGEDFPISIEDGRDRFIEFVISEPSYIRIFIKAAENSDIDFFIYRNVTRAPGTLVPDGFSTGVDAIESNVVFLTPQTDPYLLDIYFFSVDRQANCPSFYFELAIKTVNALREELTCPTVLPQPEVPNSLYDVTSDVWEYSEEFYFTKDRVDSNTHYERFVYPITLNIHANTTIFTAIGYDFLANDFRLILRNNGEVVAEGDPSGVENRDDYFNFYNLLYSYVGPGTYQLEIVEDLRHKNLTFESYCHSFSFFFVAFTDAIPQVEYVLPPGGSQLDPFQPLTVTVVFSEPVAVPQGDLAQWISSNRAVYLLDDQNIETRIYPSEASFTSGGTSLEATFAQHNFHVNKTYTLHLDATKFSTEASGTAFAAVTQSWTFRMAVCQCSSHGTCDRTGQSLNCDCETGYAGVQCQICAPGYHGVASVCTRNEACTPDTCHSHGTCDDSRGYPVCVCDYGFSSSSSCGSCAAGFTDYPSCNAPDDSSQRPTRCSAPLIPDDLDTYEFLGYNNELHLQGNYYLDVATQLHNTFFTLTEDSAFRIYVEPHWVDIDLWLYRVDQDGKILEYIDNGIAIGTEETLYRVLRGSADSPVRYMIRFRYYIWDRDHSVDCETFNLELAIAPVSDVKAEVALMHCPTSSSFPAVPAIAPGQSLSYAPSTDFAIIANASITSGANYFWGWDFQLSPPPGKRAVIKAEVGYRFLAGDLSLLLEIGSLRSHCGLHGGYEEACVNGDNLINRNYIDELVGPGNYTLWIYEPEPQNQTISTCSRFNFRVSVDYEDISEDRFLCNGRLFPSKLNSAGFLDQQGYLHLQEDFLVDADESAFNISVPSVLRAHGNSAANIDFEILDSTGATVKASAFSNNPEILAQLSPGSYIFRINSFTSSSVECPIVNLEMEISPSSFIVNACPSDESLPQLGPISLGTKFPPAGTQTIQTFVAFTNTEVVKEWTFTTDEVAILRVVLDSEFLVAGLKLELTFHDSQGPQGTRRIAGDHSYNRNFLRELLDPATYTLRIIKPRSSREVAPGVIPPCAPFNFEFELTRWSDFSNTPCLRDGEAVPSTFNSIRYLGTNGKFDYQGSNFRVPDFGGFSFHSTVTSLTVAVPSILRVYTEPHVVDIDIALFEQGQSRAVVDGGFGFNNEESFTYTLQPNVTYELQLYFWKWSGDIPDCPTFNMEVGILPVASAQLPEKLCPSAAPSRFPPAFPQKELPKSSYHYSSQKAGDDLYFQQVKDTPQTTHQYSFVLSSPANFHAELGYYFLSGDLMMKLTQRESSTVYYGTNALNGNILRVAHLLPGNYTFEIYEVAPNEESILGCSHYIFEVSIVPYTNSLLAATYPPFPSNLNSIPFLKLSDQVHLQGEYELFDGKTEEVISFSVRTQSLFRVSSTHLTNQQEAIFMLLRDSNGIPFSGFTEFLFETLPQGSYTLSLTRRSFNTTGNVGRIVAELQLAISSFTAIQHDFTHSRVTPPSPCADKGISRIVTNPQGFYQDREDQLVISPSTMQTRSLIDTIDFSLDIPSAVYFRLGYNFLLHDLTMNLTGTIRSSGNSVGVSGRNLKNQNELHQILPPGDYSLRIFSTALFNVSSLSHCAIYTSRVIIQDEANEGHRADCSTLDILPWNLNTFSGGSAPFGGPMNSGSLHLIGESFLMPVIPGQVDSMVLQLTTTSLLSVITTENYFGDIAFNVRRGVMEQAPISPLMSASDFYQHSELYVLDVGSATNVTFNLDLSYDPPRREPCPSFGMQLDVRPLADVGRALICPPLVSEKFPKKNVTTTDGFYSEYLTSYFTGNTMNSASNNGTFRYRIQITITQPSRVIANLGYGSLTNMFHLRLLRQNSNGGAYEVGTGTIQMSHPGTGNTNANQMLSGMLSGSQDGPATYFLEISQKVFQLPLFMQLDTVHCYPYVWDLQILPNNNSPYIPDVQPSMGFFLNPFAPLEIDITFSAPIFTKTAVAVNSRNTDPIKQALYLMRQDNSTTIFPTSVSTSGSSGTHWHLFFNSTQFVPQGTYRLYLKDDILFDAQNHLVHLVSTNLYSMIDTTCHGFGEFDRGYCFCNIGYAGEECDRCDYNYANANPDPNGALQCKRKSGKCFEDTCGCAPGITPCQPLGKCDPNTATCTCNTGYAGADCSQCAPGYDHFDQGCRKTSSGCGSCVHGSCDERIGQCVCEGHFAGRTCDECASGWSGSDCETASHALPSPVPHSAGLAVFSVIIFIAALLLIVATVVFLIYRRLGGGRRYMPVEGFGFESAEMSALEEDDD